jgi:hypothetical protein
MSSEGSAQNGIILPRQGEGYSIGQLVSAVRARDYQLTRLREVQRWPFRGMSPQLAPEHAIVINEFLILHDSVLVERDQHAVRSPDPPCIQPKYIPMKNWPSDPRTDAGQRTAFTTPASFPSETPGREGSGPFNVNHSNYKEKFWCREGDFIESVFRPEWYQQDAVFCVT